MRMSGGWDHSGMQEKEREVKREDRYRRKKNLQVQREGEQGHEELLEPQEEREVQLWEQVEEGHCWYGEPEEVVHLSEVWAEPEEQHVSEARVEPGGHRELVVQDGHLVQGERVEQNAIERWLR